MFSLEGHFNSCAPQRPFHTIIPAFITRRKAFISFGVMGGGMQPQGHAQIVVNLIDFVWVFRGGRRPTHSAR
jgi:gamma-glutamyltranspeptidase/glutathione hydrolase